MNAPNLCEALVEAESNVILGFQRVERQRRRVRTFEAGGFRRSIGIDLLKNLERALSRHIAERDELKMRVATLLP